MNITILGAGSATPSLLRNPSAQVLSDDHENYLIDCGEGTQFRILKNNIKANRIKNIFISHLHGDHYFGLIGLIASLNLAHRLEPLTIFGPRGLDEILTIQLKYSNTAIHFKLQFVAIDTQISKEILITDFMSVTTIPLNHRIPCCGFLFYQKPKKRRIIKEKLPEKISIEEIVQLKNGLDVLNPDQSIKYKFEDFTYQSNLGYKYAYCSDTAYFESIINIVKNVDLLYHEATFRQDLALRAITTNHSTAAEAATIAKKAGVKKLLIGHFSSRYHDISENLLEAKNVFENTEIAEEGVVYSII